MDTKLIFTGGEPNINFNDILRTPDATRDGLIAAFRAFGDNYIIQGVTGTTSITAGYVMLDGEIIKVDAHTKTSTHFVKITTFEAGGNKTFNNSIARQTWEKNRATITAGSGSLAYATADRLIDRIVAEIDDVSWTTISLINGFTGSVKVREDKFGYIEIIGEDLIDTAILALPFAVLPSAFRPNYRWSTTMYTHNQLLNAIFYENTSPWHLQTSQDLNDTSDFYIRIPKTFP